MILLKQIDEWIKTFEYLIDFALKELNQFVNVSDVTLEDIIDSSFYIEEKNGYYYLRLNTKDGRRLSRYIGFEVLEEVKEILTRIDKFVETIRSLKETRKTVKELVKEIEKYIVLVEQLPQKFSELMLKL